MNSMKMQKDTTQKDEPPSSEGVQYATKKVLVLVLLSCVQLLATPWMVALQAPPSMEFSRQGYWSGVPLPSLEYQLGYYYRGQI